jgi:hypothetical protein
MTAAVPDPLVRGRVRADGYVVDPALTGVAAARARVLAAWLPGARLHDLPDGAWLLSLPEPSDVRAEHAPGLPVRRGPDGRLQVWRHGHGHRVDVDRLPAVDVAGWFDLTDLPVVLLAAVHPAHQEVVVPAPPPAARTELRSVAGVDEDPAAERITRALAARERRRAFRSSDGAGRRRKLTGGGSTAGRGRQATSRAMSWLVTGPAGAVFRSRHERYVRALAADFQHARFDQALRRAIALDGVGGHVSLRLPLPRAGRLAPTPNPPGSARGLSTPPTVAQYLRTLYLQAANDLERLGRIEEAAFVHADLLGNAWDAVLLLERHDRFALAAELAEGRRLAPGVAIRLWWRAGHRDRAIDVARLRGGFPDAVQRLSTVDPAAARDVRAEWVRHLLDAGDLHAAVDAAWAEPSLRHLVIPRLPAGIATGGPAGARFLAHLVTHEPAPATLDAALALLSGADDALAPARAAFVSALGDLRSADRTADRRLASSALRLLTREPTLLAELPPPVARRTADGLRRRADQLLAADAPPTSISRPPAVERPIEIRAQPHPGPHEVSDAVTLPGGVLVGLGDSGARLLSPDGRVRARWDVRADQIVAADHGRAALLLGWGETTVDVHRLDLTSRKVRRWAHVPASRAAGSFDGALLTVIDDAGLAVLDTTSPRPRTVWRDLAAGVAVHGLVRGPDWLAALVQGAAVGVDLVPQLWSWSLPELTLRHRSPIRLPAAEAGPLLGLAVGAGSGLLRLHRPASGPLLTLYGASGEEQARATSPDLVAVLADGPFHATVRDGDGQLTVDVLMPWQPRSWPVPSIRVGLTHAVAAAMRVLGNVVTVHDHRGRVVGVDVTSGRILANLTMRE